MIYRINFKKHAYRILVIFAFSLFLLSQTAESLESASSSIELEGNIVPISTLSLITQGRKFQSGQNVGALLSLNQVDALGAYKNPSGRSSHSLEKSETYYQTDLQVRVQISGSNTTTNLVISQMDSGPLRGLIYETNQQYDISQTSQLQPIPQLPQKLIAVSNITNGTHDFDRQIILRVPANLSAGVKNAVIQYSLEATP